MAVLVEAYFANGLVQCRRVSRYRAVNQMLREDGERVVPSDADLFEVYGVASVILVPAVIQYFKNRVVLPVSAPRATKEGVFVRDDGICQYCGRARKRAEASIDHILPRSRGGGDTWDNLALACKPCNHRKGQSCTYERGNLLLVCNVGLHYACRQKHNRVRAL